MVRMVFRPLTDGIPVTKSSWMWDQGRLGIRRGWRCPAESWVEASVRAQTSRAETISRTSDPLTATKGHVGGVGRVIFGSGCPESREKRAKPPDDFGRERPAGVGKLTGERFHLSVFGTRTIGKMKVVGLKKKSLKSLCGIELLGCLNVYQILMVGPN